jgi:RNA polymerase-binding protein DksA
MDTAGVRAALLRERSATAAQRDQLHRDLNEVIAAVTDVATDDEHDPEGATIAYERARTKALLEQAEAHLAEITQALERLDAGTYGTCAQCGGPIGAERLRARPAVRTCITCAAR